METIVSSTDAYTEKVKQLASAFARTAAERDRLGDTPKAERDQLRASGLLKLIIPSQYGGMGAKWPEALWAVREIAKADSSLAHVFGYHHLQLATPHFYGTPAQRAHYYRETAAKNWFWGNAINPKDTRLIVSRDGDGYVLNGTKYFCSGAKDSDVLVVSAVSDGGRRPHLFVLPSNRTGIIFHDDWNGMGQRQTDSGSVSFHSVRVQPDEHLCQLGTNVSPFATLRTVLTQLIMTHIFVGIAEGALEEAKKYTHQTAHVRKGDVLEDPYILRHYGELWSRCHAAGQITNHAAEVFQWAWEQQFDLTDEQRGKAAVTVYAAKVTAIEVALHVTNRMFDVMGARAADEKYRFDRYWRNIRTFSLHDSIDVKLRELGAYFLNDTYPVSGFYS
jgi:alkylation response protein AidB-like acyl-CoA dehydrogenase